MFDENTLKTTDDQLGHLIGKVENCRTNIVQKIDLAALANIVDDHATLIRHLNTSCHSEGAPEESPAEQNPLPQTGGGTPEAEEDITPQPQKTERPPTETPPQEITLPPSAAPRKVTIILE